MEYHPEEVIQFDSIMAGEKRIEYSSVFLKIQRAYQILHDPKRRLHQDFKLTSVQCDVIEDDIINPHPSQPFNLFINSSRFEGLFLYRI